MLVAHLLKLVEESLVDLASADHIDCGIHIAVDQRCVGNQAKWHGVENDVVVHFLQLRNEHFQTIAHQEAGRVGWNGTDIHEVEVFVELAFDDNVVHAVHLFGEVCAHANAVVADVHIVGEATLTQV